MSDYGLKYLISDKRFLPFKRYLLLLLMINNLWSGVLLAQNDLILQDVILGKADVSAPGSITLKPGFQAKEGSNFHAFIGANQGQNSSLTLTSPSSGVTPAAGSTGMNYVKSIICREAKTTIPSGSYKHIEEIQYYDGLGRPVQSIQAGASPLGNDIIQPVLYDNFGREAKKTLQYTASKTGDFRTGVTEVTVNTYYNSSSTPVGKIADSRAYSETTFDNSPLNRIVTQTGPGSDWAVNNKNTTVSYLTNTSTETGWNVTDNYSYSSFSYAANTLFITETRDDQGNYTREYKDKQGQVILKKAKLGNDWLRTAYIYDDFGHLRCVVPPEATDPTTDTDLCYYYLYDARNRMIEKKIPGGGIVRMVYDKRDRLRCSQNSNQASPVNEWTFIKYDELNRPVITGTFTSSSGTIALETAINAATLSETRNNTTTNSGYTSVSYPTTGGTVLSATYYDDYAFITGMSLSDSLNSTKFDAGSYNFAAKTDLTPRGQVTGTMIKVLSASSDLSAVPHKTLYSTSYYDKFGHLLRSISENHLKGKDVVSNLYEDITYQVLQSKQEHHKGAEHLTIEKWFEYDHTGRVLATREKVNSQPEVTLNAMKYNEVGELVTKYLHSNQTTGTRTFVQKTDYQYNIRGWLTMINDAGLAGDNDMYGMQLFYNSTSGMGSLAPASGLYSGNIVGMKWGIKNEAIKGYQFTYDNLNRMLQGNYAEGSSLNTNSGYNSEIISQYDKNGNIKALQRKYNNITVDNLTYTYFDKANWLKRVTDTGTASSLVDDYPATSQNYTYDANGNMTYDGAKNLTVSYNPTINLPKQLDFGGNNRIFYHYTTAGSKLVKHTVPATGTGTYTHYISNIVYDGGSLSYIMTDEGRLVAVGTGTDRKFLYEYNLKDHLGNNRVTFMGTDLGGAVDIVQTTSYYPFGLVMNQYNGNTATGYQKNKYLYNGKEFQDESLGGVNLDWYDYGARFYDPQIGRWNVIDPVAEVNRRWSPYTYAINNPLRFIDLDGNDWWDVVLGFASAVIDNVTGGSTNVRSTAGNYVTERRDFNQGLNSGDATSIALGGAMIMGGGEQIKNGTALAGASLAVELESGGTSSVPAIGGGGLILSGTLNIGLGMILEAQGTKNLKDQKGQLSENKVNPKKEARELAKEKRDQQPASEDYAKYKAKEIEKAKGKDARREAHDAKDKGGTDRTKKEIDEDYNAKRK